MSKYRLTKPAMGWPHVVRESDGVVMTPGELIKEFNSLERRLVAAEALNVRLAKFFLRAIQCSFDGCDYDGGSMQEDALALGLIVETEPPEGEEGPWYTVPREIDRFDVARPEVKGE